MSVCAGGARLVRRVGHPFRTPVAELPLFLCPGWIGASRAQFHYQQSYTTSAQTLHSTSTPTRLPQFTKLQPSDLLLTKLPTQCSGCGALSQVVDKDEAGYYNLKRRSVSEYLRGESALRRSEEDAIIEKSLQAATAIDPEILKQLSFLNSRSQPGRKINSVNMSNELTLKQDHWELLILLSATGVTISSTMIQACLYTILPFIPSRIHYLSLPTRSTMSTTLSTRQISLCPSFRGCTSFCI